MTLIETIVSDRIRFLGNDIGHLRYVIFTQDKVFYPRTLSPIYIYIYIYNSNILGRVKSLEMF